MERLKRNIRRVLVNWVAMAYPMPKTFRRYILRLCGMRIGAAVLFSGSLFRDTDVKIGNGSFVNHGCFVDVGALTIGDDVYVSNNVTFATGDHDIGGPEKRAGPHLKKPIHVKNGVWIGTGAIILGGVTIGDGCIIGAGAVVTEHCFPHGVYVGVPATRAHDLPC
jgi:acetyltransferase-like isoleucine patch superfamily enzyme